VPYLVVFLALSLYEFRRKSYFEDLKDKDEFDETIIVLAEKVLELMGSSESVDIRFSDTKDGQGVSICIKKIAEYLGKTVESTEESATVNSNVFDTDYSMTEQIVSVMEYQGYDFLFTDEETQAMIAGIKDKTGNFTVATTANTYSAMAYILKRRDGG
jgi:hypothetical protein